MCWTLSLTDGFHDMDAFVGGLAEDHVEGGSVGELFAHIISDQFFRLRNGDRHWYENTDVSGNSDLLKKICPHPNQLHGCTTMAQVVKRNSQLHEDNQVWDGHHSGFRSAFLIPASFRTPAGPPAGAPASETVSIKGKLKKKADEL